MADLLLAIPFAAAACVWLGVAVLAWAGVVLLPRLGNPPESGGKCSSGASEAARATVVIAARDEAERIGDTIRLVLAARDVGRVVLVDDRSADGTGEVARSIEDERLTVLRVEDLPEGWLGKPHALHVALRYLEGESNGEGAGSTADGTASSGWTLLLDADTHVGPGMVTKAIELAERSGVDHVAALPGFRHGSAFGTACVLSAYTVFVARAAAGQFGVPRCETGVGAFNLVRTEVLAALDPFETLRMEVVDDVKLAILLGRAGYRTRIAMAPEGIEIDWRAELGMFLKLIEKNTFALARFSVVRAAGYVALNVVCVVLAAIGLPLAVLGLTLGTVSGIAMVAATVALGATAVPGVLLARAWGWPGVAGVLAPFAAWTIGLAMLNSTVATVREGGITWRGTRYPLEQLRAGQVW